MSVAETVLEAAPTTAPYQCAGCTKGLPGDGPFLKLPTANRFGDVWLCGGCQEVVLGVNRLMSVRVFEQRVAELKGHVEAEVQATETERSRLLDVERQ